VDLSEGSSIDVEEHELPLQVRSVKLVIASPPVSGATQDTVAEPSPTTTVGAAGAAGTVDGEIATVVAAAPVPAELIARTENVTLTPFRRPVTVQLRPSVEHVDPLEAATM